MLKAILKAVITKRYCEFALLIIIEYIWNHPLAFIEHDTPYSIKTSDKDGFSSIIRSNNYCRLQYICRVY